MNISGVHVDGTHHDFSACVHIEGLYEVEPRTRWTHCIEINPHVVAPKQRVIKVIAEDETHAGVSDYITVLVQRKRLTIVVPERHTQILHDPCFPEVCVRDQALDRISDSKSTDYLTLVIDVVTIAAHRITRFASKLCGYALIPDCRKEGWKS